MRLPPDVFLRRKDTTDCGLQSLRSGMPAANHAPAGLRMRRTGLAHGIGGSGLSTSSIRKSPLAASGTSPESNSAAPAGSQISVARTLWFALPPIPLPPASSRPLPLTLTLPSVFTSALRAAMVQIWPGGWTPRTMLRLTTVAVAAAPWPLETGITPMPPLNLARVSSAIDASGTSPRHSTANFLNIGNPPGYRIDGLFFRRVVPCRWIATTPLPNVNGGGLSYTLAALSLFRRNAMMNPSAVNDMWKGLLAEYLGMRFLETGPDRVVAELEIRDHLRTIRGPVHGGTLMALADAVGGTAALINLP